MEVLLDSMLEGTTVPEMLMADLNQDGVANYYVAFLRLICSGYLRENAALYSGFIEGGRTLDQFCRDEVKIGNCFLKPYILKVEPMWKDCDHVCIIALVNAIGKKHH